MRNIANKSFYDNLPKKRMAAGVLFFNEKDEILILKPNYKETWNIPGGIVEGDESPMRAAIREVKEELGLEISEPEFLCVNYVSHSGEENESLQFLFKGGTLDSEQIGSFKIPNDEIIDYKFVKTKEIQNFLNDKLKWRINECQEALKKGIAIYLDFPE